MKNATTTLSFVLLLAACGTNNSSSMTKDVSIPGFSSAKVLECNELAHGGAAHRKAEVIQNIHDFGSSFTVKVYDTLVSDTTPVATLTKCTGSVDANNLSCDDSNTLRPAGFAQTFAITNAALKLATYTSVKDLASATSVALSCQAAK